MPHGIWSAVLAGLWVLLLAQSAMLVVLCRHMRGLYHLRSQFPDRGEEPGQIGPALGEAAPEIQVTDIHGAQLVLGGPSERKRLLIFLAPHCPACRLAIRMLQTLQPDEAEVITIWGAEPKRVRDLVEEYHLRVPTVADEHLYVRRQFGVVSVPLAVTVDEQGRIAGRGFNRDLERLRAVLGLPGASAAAGAAAEPEVGSPMAVG